MYPDRPPEPPAAPPPGAPGVAGPSTWHVTPETHPHLYGPLDPDLQADPFDARLGPCPHRLAHWRCGGEVSCSCRLGRGQAGIVDFEDCRACAFADAGLSVAYSRDRR